MVNKNYDLKINKSNLRKILFYSILIIYISGLCCGCTFALKNAENLNFIIHITGIEKMLKGENTANFSAFLRLYLRDIAVMTIILVLKYSGVLKGLCICIPFISALQNACIYTVYFNKNFSFTDIITNYILRDTAVAFVVLIFCFVTSKDIISARHNPKRDIQKLVVYLTGVTLVYCIDFVIKIFIG